MSEIQRLSHACFSSKNLDKTIKFYRDLLGCRIVHKFINDQNECYGVFFSANNGTFLEFFKTDKIKNNSGPFRHICFQTDDIYQFSKRFETNGFEIKISRGRTDQALHFYVNDPDDNMIEFHQYDGKSIQTKYLPELNIQPNSGDSLLKSDSVVLDTSGKSIAYFCIDETVQITKSTIEELKNESKVRGNCNIRICLHNSPKSEFHEMIILERPGLYVPPHKHTEKEESCHIIEGRIGVFIFDDNGNVARSSIVAEDNNFIFRIEKNQWHMLIPLSDPVIYHESKPGPFTATENNIYPGWFTPQENPQALNDYVENLLTNMQA